MGQHVGMPAFMPHGKITPMQLLKLQAEGKLAGPVPVKELKRQLAQLEKHPKIQLNFRRPKGGKSVAMWSSLTDYDALLGSNKGNTKTLAAINTYTTAGCEDPIGLKVDGSKNIWAGCEYNSSTGESSATEWNSSGTEVDAYDATCPIAASKGSCDYDYGYGFDSAANSSDVFVAMTFYEYDECTPSCAYVYGGGFEYWPAGDPTATPVLVPASAYGAPVYDVYYMDLDSSGNIWFDYYGCTTAACGYGLGEVTNPTTSPSFVSVEPPGTYEYAGGVYASNGGSTINVIDQDTHMVYQYNTSGTKTGELGPTAFGIGDPVTGGFGPGDKNMAIGDADGWVNIGTVSSNKWTVGKAPLDVSAVEGAAYTPSDK